MKRAGAAALAVLVTGLCLWVLLTPAAVDALSRAAAQARVLPLIGAFVLAALVQWLRAWRFAIMTDGKLSLPGHCMVRIAMQLNVLNFVLPFRLGELSYPVLMRHHFGHALLHSAGVLMLVRVFDLATVVAILLGSAALLRVGEGTVWILALWVGAAVSALAPFLVLALGKRLRPLLVRLPHVGGVADRLTVGIDALRDRRAGLFAIVLGYGIWLIFGWAAMLAASAVTSTISGPVAFLGASAGNIAFALPVNGIAGIGPSQAAWVTVVTGVGVPWDDAVVSALTLHAVVLANAIVLGGVASIGGIGRPDRAPVTAKGNDLRA